MPQRRSRGTIRSEQNVPASPASEGDVSENQRSHLRRKKPHLERIVRCVEMVRYGGSLASRRRQCRRYEPSPGGGGELTDSRGESEHVLSRRKVSLGEGSRRQREGALVRGACVCECVRRKMRSEREARAPVEGPEKTLAATCADLRKPAFRFITRLRAPGCRAKSHVGRCRPGVIGSAGQERLEGGRRRSGKSRARRRKRGGTSTTVLIQCTWSSGFVQYAT